MPTPQYLEKAIAPELPRFRPGSKLPQTPSVPRLGVRITPCEEDFIILRCVAPLRNRPELAIKLISNQLAYFDERNAAR